MRAHSAVFAAIAGAGGACVTGGYLEHTGFFVVCGVLFTLVGIVVAAIDD